MAVVPVTELAPQAGTAEPRGALVMLGGNRKFMVGAAIFFILGALTLGGRLFVNPDMRLSGAYPQDSPRPGRVGQGMAATVRWYVAEGLVTRPLPGLAGG